MCSFMGLRLTCNTLLMILCVFLYFFHTSPACMLCEGLGTKPENRSLKNEKLKYESRIRVFKNYSVGFKVWDEARNRSFKIET